MPSFTQPIHEHGDKGEPNYPHKGGAAKGDPSLTPTRLAQKIQQLVGQRQYAHYGVRVDNNSTLKVGQTAPRSSDWSDEDRPVDLAGTAAVKVADWKRVINYSGDYIVLLGSQDAVRGHDRSEIVMQDAVVLGVWKPPAGFWGKG